MRAAIFAFSLALDRYIGEPPAAVHPVIAMGAAVELAIRQQPRLSEQKELAFGVGLAGALPLASAGLAWLGCRLLQATPTAVALVAEAWLLNSLFAVRGLQEAAMAVQTSLITDDIAAARVALPALVSRPVAELDSFQIASAAIESVAENVADAFIGPWLAFAVGGVPAAAWYRAVNTLDSMIGYHGRYERVGKASARLDDLVNLIPARLAALCIIIGALPDADARGAWQVARRDHAKTASPNAGWPMAAMAGALGVTLTKPGHYALNASAPSPRPVDIRRACQVMYRATLWSVALMTVLIVSMAHIGQTRATKG